MERRESLLSDFAPMDPEGQDTVDYGNATASKDCLVLREKIPHHDMAIPPSQAGKWRSAFSSGLFTRSSRASSERLEPEPSQPPDSKSHMIRNRLQASKLSNIFKLVDKLHPTIQPDFDEYQEHFPPKAFPSPDHAWYTVPTKDDGSHSWPLADVWPPQFIVDLRKHVPLFMAMFVAVVLPISLVQRYAQPATQKVGNRPGYDCMHSGDFSLRGTDVNFGQMPFPQAKAIDLVWNAIVGRGMQVFLMFISSKIFYSALMYISERHPVTYDLFAAVSLTPTATNGIRPLVKAVIFNSGWKSRLMLCWLLGTTVYIALTPVFVDALSGYRAIQATVLQLADGSKLDVSSGFTANAYQDLKRNQPPDFYDVDPITGQWGNRTPTFELTSNATMIYFSGLYRIDEGGQNTTEVFSSSCINTTTSVLFYSADHYTYFRGGSPLKLFDDSSCQVWFPLAPVINGDAYGEWNTSYLRDKDNYECVSREIYTWGFSYELLLIYSCISAAWTLGTWILYVYASVHSEFYQKGRGFGTWRAILDISDSLREMTGHGNLCAYSEKELDGSLQGRNMAMYESFEGENGSRQIGLREIHHGRRARGRLELEWDRVYG